MIFFVTETDMLSAYPFLLFALKDVSSVGAV